VVISARAVNGARVSALPCPAHPSRAAAAQRLGAGGLSARARPQRRAGRQRPPLPAAAPRDGGPLSHARRGLVRGGGTATTALHCTASAHRLTDTHMLTEGTLARPPPDCVMKRVET
jgi:hypothetical protein